MSLFYSSRRYKREGTVIHLGIRTENLLCDSTRKRSQDRWIFYSLLFLLLTLPNPVFGGFAFQGAKAGGMGTAFIAVADDPSALTFNPAGLTQLKGTNFYGGATAIFPSNTYESPSGQTERTESQVFFSPHIYICSDLGTQDFRFGLGLFSPFGIGGRKWSETGLTRYVSVENNTSTLAVNPAVAYRLLPNLSVAAGLDYVIAKIDAKVMVNQSSVGARDGELRLSGNGDGWGFNLGVLYTPVKRWSLGLAYRSGIKVNYKGELKLDNVASALQPLLGSSRFATDIRTTQHFPPMAGFGIAFRPTDKWTLTVELEWVGWSSFDEAVMELKRKVPGAGLSDRVTRFDWKDVWAPKLGIEYKVSDRLSLRGGYVFAQTPVPSRTLDPSNPDSTQHDLSIGFGYRSGQWVFDFFSMAAFFVERNVQNPILSGNYKSSVHYLVGFSMGSKF